MRNKFSKKLVLFSGIIFFSIFFLGRGNEKQEGIFSPILIFNPTTHSITTGFEVEFKNLGLKKLLSNKFVKLLDGKGKEVPFQIEDNNENNLLDSGDIFYFSSTLPPGYSIFNLCYDSQPVEPLKSSLFVEEEKDYIIISGEDFKIYFSKKSGLPERYISQNKEIKIFPSFKIYGVSLGRVKEINYKKVYGEMNLETPASIKIVRGPLRTKIIFVRDGLSGSFYIYPDGKIESNIEGDKDKINGVFEISGLIRKQFPQILLAMNYGKVFKKESSYQCGGRFFFGGVFNPEENIGIGVAQPHKEELDRPYPWIRIPSQNITNPEYTSIWLHHLPGDSFFILFYKNEKKLQEMLDVLRTNIRIWSGAQVMSFWQEEKVFLENAFLELKKLGYDEKLTPSIEKYEDFYNVSSLYKRIIELSRNWLDQCYKKEIPSLEKGGFETAGIKLSAKYAELLLNISEVDLSLGRIDRHHKRLLTGLKELVNASNKLNKKIPKQLYGKDGEFIHGLNIATSCYARPLEADYGYCANIFEPFLMDEYFRPLDALEIRDVHFNYTWDRFEPEEGKYNFEELDQLMDVLKKHNKRIFFQIGDNVSIGMCPKWVEKKYPDWVYRDFQGTWMEKSSFTWVSPTLYGNVPEWMNLLMERVEKILSRYKEYEGSTISAWGIWNEPNFRCYGNEYLFNQKPFLNCFQNFLKERYGNIGELNKYWGTNYTSFSDVKREPFIKAENENGISLNGDWFFKIDPENKGIQEKWYEIGYPGKEWRIIKVPGYWENQFEDLKDYNGYAWYWKRVSIPEELKGKPLTLKFSGVDDDCIVYINGKKVYENKGYNVSFEIDISKEVQKTDELIIAVQVYDNFQDGGIYKDVTIFYPGAIQKFYKFPARVTDWVEFLNGQLAGFLKYWNDGIHKNTSLPVLEKVGHEIDKKLMLQSGHDTFTQSNCFWGAVAYDFYNPPKEITLFSDIMRSAHNKPIWIGEFGYYTVDSFNNLIIPAHLIVPTCWSGFLHGVNRFYHWLWLSYTAFSDHWSSPTDQLIEIAKLNAVGNIAPQIFSAVPERKIAFFFPFHSTLLSDGDTIRMRWEKLYYLLNDMNIPVDFIDRKKMDEGVLNKYKLIIIPSSPYLDRKTAEKIKNYVKEGGKVFAYSDLAFWDEKGIEAKEKPGFGLSEVFGANVIFQYKIPEKIELVKGFEIRTKHFIYPISLNSANAYLKSEGITLISKNNYGKGIAYLCGIDIGKIYEDIRDLDISKTKSLIEFLFKFLSENEVVPEVKFWFPGIETQVIKNDKASYLVVINWLPFTTELEVPILCDLIKENEIYDLFSFEKAEVQQDKPYSILKTSVPSNCVKIYFLGKI